MEEETPSWLTGLPAQGGKKVAVNEVPDWFRDLDQKGAEPARESEVPEIEVEEAGQVPNWLKQMGHIEPTAEMAVGPGAEVSRLAEGAAGEPLTEGPSLEQGAPTTPRPLPLPQTTVEMKTPDRLEARPSTGDTTDTDMPAWVKAMQPTAARSGPARAGLTPGMQAGELLTGIRGALTARAAVSAVKAREEVHAEITAEGADKARVFQDIVSQPLVAAAVPVARRRRRFWAWLGRMVLYLLIIAAVVVPLYWQGALEMGFFSEYNIPISARTQGVHKVIDTLPARSSVLVALDYDPTLAEELNTQARVLLQHLMQRKFKILSLSTTPTGPEMMQRLMDELAARPEYGYKYGEDYINLGYLPGQETSLLLFGHSPLSAVRVDFRDGRDLSERPIVADLKRVPEQRLGQVVPLMIALSGTQEGLRTWIEQVGTPYGVRMIAGVTGGIEPYAQPYLDSEQLSGLLSGLPGAAEYEALTQKPGRAVRGLDSQVAVHLLLCGLIVLGNMAYGIKRVFGRR
jgi:hypothetical protein